MSTLIKPLFVDGNFNRKGKRMRAEYVKTIACDDGEYSLYISAGSKENNYSQGGNDTHYLYTLVGEYLIPCGRTEYKLEQDAGYLYLVKSLYGSEKERNSCFDELRKGKDWEEGNKLVTARIAEENGFIDEHKTNEHAQAGLLRLDFDRCIARYLDARDNGGKFADFIGAAFLGEVDKCLVIADVLKAERAVINEQKRRERMEDKQKEDAEREQKELEAIQEAENILKDGGTIKDGELIVKIADKHGVAIPLRTRGWILNTLAECTINGDSVSYRYYKKKNGQGSQKVYDIISDIRKALQAA